LGNKLNVKLSPHYLRCHSATYASGPLAEEFIPSYHNAELVFSPSLVAGRKYFQKNKHVTIFSSCMFREEYPRDTGAFGSVILNEG
jgi:hypothetical protein